MLITQEQKTILKWSSLKGILNVTKATEKKGRKKTVLNQNHLKILADFDIKQETFSDNLFGMIFFWS